MKNKAIIRTVQNAVLLLALIFVTDRTIAYFLTKMYSSGKSGDFYQTTYAVRSAKEEVLIFGSSRATHHYISEEFERNFRMSAYNLGRDGRNILYSYTIFSNILATHKPKIVILDVQPTEFTWKAGKEGEDAMISALLPYTDIPSIRASISQVRKTDILVSEIFKTYPYNSNLLQILGYHFGVMHGEETVKGYIPLNGSKVSARNSAQDQKEALKPDTTLVNTFKRFMALATANDINLCVVVSPTTASTENSSIPLIRELTQQAGVTFYDFSKSKSFNDTKLFYDPTHLNHEGAGIFTDLLVKELTRTRIPSVSRLAQATEVNENSGELR